MNLSAKKPFVPLPQPKKVVSAQSKAIGKRMGEIKRELGVRGKVNAGDLIAKSRSLRQKVAIMGLV